MPKFEEHVRKSIERTGKEWRGVHEFLDGKDLSIIKKLKRHNIFTVERNFKEIERRFGKEGVEEYLRHVEEDYQKFPLTILWKLFGKRVKRR